MIIDLAQEEINFIESCCKADLKEVQEILWLHRENPDLIELENSLTETVINLQELLRKVKSLEVEPKPSQEIH